MNVLGNAILCGGCVLLQSFPFREKQVWQISGTSTARYYLWSPFPLAVFQFGVGGRGGMEVEGWKEHGIWNQEV